MEAARRSEIEKAVAKILALLSFALLAIIPFFMNPEGACMLFLCLPSFIVFGALALTFNRAGKVHEPQGLVPAEELEPEESTPAEESPKEWILRQLQKPNDWGWFEDLVRILLPERWFQPKPRMKMKGAISKANWVISGTVAVIILLALCSELLALFD